MMTSTTVYMLGLTLLQAASAMLVEEPVRDHVVRDGWWSGEDDWEMLADKLDEPSPYTSPESTPKPSPRQPVRQSTNRRSTETFCDRCATRCSSEAQYRQHRGSSNCRKREYQNAITAGNVPRPELEMGNYPDQPAIQQRIANMPDQARAEWYAVQLSIVRAGSKHGCRAPPPRRWRFDELSATDEGGFTKLHKAASHNAPALITWLLDNGVYVDQPMKQFDNYTALHWAALLNKMDACRALMEGGASEHRHNSNGESPLQLSKRSHEIVALRRQMTPVEPPKAMIELRTRPPAGSECAICLGTCKSCSPEKPSNTKSAWVQMNCCHNYFHHNCAMKAWAHNDRCAMCRRDDGLYLKDCCDSKTH